jgi:3-oxoacyl-[acyl-carrier protein] reductase
MLQNKIVLITGSSKGLGREIARFFHNNGAKVILHYFLGGENAIKLSKELGAFLVQGDLTKKERVEFIFSQIREKYGKIDILINNVGNFYFKNILNLSDEEFKDEIESNLYSVWNTMKAVNGLMDKGKIINFTCVGADKLAIRKNTTPYYISKAGVLMLTKNFAEEFSNIQVNSISLGVLESSIVIPESAKGKEVNFSQVIDVIKEIIFSDKTGENIELSNSWYPEGYN